jgi:hypothetical protein
LYNLTTGERKGVEFAEFWFRLIDYRTFADAEMQGDNDLKLLGHLDDAFAIAFGFAIG